MIKGQNAQQAQGIADFYQLLGILFRLPQEEMVQSLFDGTLADNADEILEEVNLSQERYAIIRGALDDLRAQAKKGNITLPLLRHAYTTLFTHPERPRVFIHESQFLFWEANPDSSYDLAPRMFVSPAALDAERCYKKAGLYRSKERNESADHISTELEFMARLFAHKAALLEQGGAGAELSDIDALVEEFNYYHLNKWGLAFFEKCATSEVQPVYQALGVVGHAFLSEMLECSEPECSEEGGGKL